MTNRGKKEVLNIEAFYSTSQWDLVVEYLETENTLRNKRMPKLPAEQAMYNDRLFRTIFGTEVDSQVSNNGYLNPARRTK